MAEKESIEGTLTRIGRTLGRLDQTLQECWGKHSENKTYLQEQVSDLGMDEYLETIRQEVDAILSQQTR
jgi:hypothetical protein